MKATEMLHILKTQNKRLFIIVLVILSMWFITIGYLVYILNDIETTETTTTETYTQEVSNIDDVENSTINNGG